jgi:hypothetical protein
MARYTGVSQDSSSLLQTALERTPIPPIFLTDVIGLHSVLNPDVSVRGWRTLINEGDEQDTSDGICWETRTGWVTNTDKEGRPMVDFAGNPAGPRVARKLVPLEGEPLREAIATRRPVQLRFEDGNTRRPVIVGLESEDGTRSNGDFQIFESRDGLILRCGKASLTLLRNGKVVLKGTYVETHSEGVNRIKGGVVDIG